jgi:ATP-dependent RNA helicase DDX1
MSGGFADLGLQSELLQSIEELGWLLPTDIQDEAIPLILGGGDVMGAAETGSGKTAAFALPILQSVHERLRGISSKAATASQKSGKNEAQVTIKLNVEDKEEGITLSPDGLTCSHTSTSNNWVGIRSTHGINKGKFYYEIKVLSSGNCRVGWSTIAAHLELGKDSQGFGYGGKGWKSYNGSYEKYGGEYNKNDMIGVYIDFNDKVIFFSKNGEILENAFIIPESMYGTVLFPTIALSNCSCSVNFGASSSASSSSSSSSSSFSSSSSSFTFPPIQGYLPLAKSFNLYDMNSSECYQSKGKRQPSAIIIEPTKDLAEQVYTSFQDLSRYIDSPKLAIHLLIGDGGRYSKNNDADIIIGTIGLLFCLCSLFVVFIWSLSLLYFLFSSFPTLLFSFLSCFCTLFFFLMLYSST